MKQLLVATFGLVCAALCSPASAQDNSIRFGIVHVDPHSSATDAVGPFLLGPPSGVSLSVKSQDTAYFSYARGFGPNLEVEFALGVPPTHDVTAKLNPAIVPGYIVAAFQGQTVAKVRQFAPTAFVNYKFLEPSSAWRPYVGAGINYTKFDKRQSTATGNALNGGPTDIQLKDSTGLALQAGVSYRMPGPWSFNAGLSTADVKTTLTANTSGATRTIDIKFSPVVLTLSAGYSF
jgi:outer membrane protein